MTLDKQHVNPVRLYYRESDSSPMQEVSSTVPLPVTSSGEAVSAFGETLVTEPTPVIQIANQYQIDPANRKDLETFTVTGGTLVDAFTVPANGDATVDLSKLSDILNPEDTLTLAAKTISGTSTAMTGAVVWKEEK